MKPNSNIIFIILTALIVAAGVYWYFFVSLATEPPLSVGVSENVAQAQFQSLASQLPETFDTRIFTDPNFAALVDITTPIAPEPAGRPDPFAPVAGISAQ